MNEQVTDKECPYCRKPLQSAVQRIVCSQCGVEYHVECWNESQGCTTFGCTGSATRIESQASATPRSIHTFNQTGYTTTHAKIAQLCLSKCGLGHLDRMDELADAIEAGHKIQAIKILREVTGLGLKESQDIVEAVAIESGCENVPPIAKSGCYIATACYGDASHPDVEALREFRDRVLIRSHAGRKLVGLYYTYSPSLAQRLGRHRRVSAIIRHTVLEPFVVFIRKLLLLDE